MATQKITPQKQQDLQTQYQNYKNLLQSLASKIGDVEQEQEEHKYEASTLP
jgi:prefoldin subunit 2